VVVHVRGTTETYTAYADTDVAVRTQVTVIGQRSGCGSDAVTIEACSVAEGQPPWATESAEWPCVTLVFNPREPDRGRIATGVSTADNLMFTRSPLRLIGYRSSREGDDEKWPDPMTMASRVRR
jgi:hypothetical protein